MRTLKQVIVSLTMIGAMFAWTAYVAKATMISQAEVETIVKTFTQNPVVNHENRDCRQ